MTEWLYSFTSDVETVEEEQDSLEKLRKVISFERSNDVISSGLLDFTAKFIRTTFEDLLPSIAHHNFMYKYCGWVSDNCFTESENSTLARDTFGPKPTNKLHVSGDKILKVRQTRNIPSC